MKNLVVIFFLFISLSITAQTSQEEYDYVTKELKEQLVKGLELKKGYTLEEFLKSDMSEESWDITFYLFKKEDVKTPVAIVLVSRSSISYLGSFFYCIPAINSKSEIWEKFKESIKGFEDCLTYEYSLALSKALTSN